MVYALLLRIDHVGVRATWPVKKKKIRNGSPSISIPLQCWPMQFPTTMQKWSWQLDLVQTTSIWCSIYVLSICTKFCFYSGANPPPSFLPSRSRMVMHSIIVVAETSCPSLGWLIFFFFFSGCAIIYFCRLTLQYPVISTCKLST